MNERYLRNLLAEDDSTGIADLMLAAAALATIDAQHQEFQITTPEWVTDKMIAVRKEIIDRNKAEMLRRLKAAKARRASLATAEEKRAGLDAEIEALEKALL